MRCLQAFVAAHVKAYFSISLCLVKKSVWMCNWLAAGQIPFGGVVLLCLHVRRLDAVCRCVYRHATIPWYNWLFEMGERRKMMRSLYCELLQTSLHLLNMSLIKNKSFQCSFYCTLKYFGLQTWRVSYELQRCPRSNVSGLAGSPMLVLCMC